GLAAGIGAGEHEGQQDEDSDGAAINEELDEGQELDSEEEVHRTDTGEAADEENDRMDDRSREYDAGREDDDGHREDPPEDLSCHQAAPSGTLPLSSRRVAITSSGTGWPAATASAA